MPGMYLELCLARLLWKSGVWVSLLLLAMLERNELGKWAFVRPPAEIPLFGLFGIKYANLTFSRTTFSAKISDDALSYTQDCSHISLCTQEVTFVWKSRCRITEVSWRHKRPFVQCLLRYLKRERERASKLLMYYFMCLRRHTMASSLTSYQNITTLHALKNGCVKGVLFVELFVKICLVTLKW